MTEIETHLSQALLNLSKQQKVQCDALCTLVNQQSLRLQQLSKQLIQLSEQVIQLSKHVMP